MRKRKICFLEDTEWWIGEDRGRNGMRLREKVFNDELQNFANPGRATPPPLDSICNYVPLGITVTVPMPSTCTVPGVGGECFSRKFSGSFPEYTRNAKTARTSDFFFIFLLAMRKLYIVTKMNRISWPHFFSILLRLFFLFFCFYLHLLCNMYAVKIDNLYVQTKKTLAGRYTEKRFVLHSSFAVLCKGKLDKARKKSTKHQYQYLHLVQRILLALTSNRNSFTLKEWEEG